MRSRHIVASGNRFRFVCRIPRDILHLFPTDRIWKPIKATDARSARLLANAWEYRTQQLFLQLRSGMLPKDLERLLVATFLKQGTDCLEARAKGQPVAGNGHFAEDPGALSRALDTGFEALGKATGLTERDSRKKRAVVFEEAAHDIEELIGDRDTMMFEETARSLVETLREPYGIVITAKEAKAVILPLMNA